MRPVSGKQWQMRSREKKWKMKTDILKTIWLDASLWCVCGSGGQRWSRWCLIIGPLSTSGDQLDKTLFLFYYYYFKTSLCHHLSQRERTVSIWRIRSHSVSSGRMPWQHLLHVWRVQMSFVCFFLFYFLSPRSPLFQKLGHPILKLIFLIQFFFLPIFESSTRPVSSARTLYNYKDRPWTFLPTFQSWQVFFLLLLVSNWSRYHCQSSVHLRLNTFRDRNMSCQQTTRCFFFIIFWPLLFWNWHYKKVKAGESVW